MTSGFTNKHLQKMNGILEMFGFEGPKQRVRWFDTFHPELCYFIEKDAKNTRIVSPTGLFGVEADWEKHFMGEVYGKGFVIAVWKPGISRGEHLARFGTMAPYFGSGHYEPIENTKREPHEVPTEKVTLMLRDLLDIQIQCGADLEGNYDGGQIIQICPRCQTDVTALGVTCDYCGLPIEEVAYRGNPILEALAMQHKAQQDAINNPVEDEIEDTFTAFMKVPGKRGGHVSFGGTNFKQEALTP